MQHCCHVHIPPVQQKPLSPPVKKTQEETALTSLPKFMIDHLVVVYQCDGPSDRHRYS